MVYGGLDLSFSDIGDEGKTYLRVDGTNIIIHNMATYHSKAAAISAIRKIPGIYAWYETLFPFDKDENNEHSIEIFKSLVLKDNFPKTKEERTIQPIIDYKLEISSHNNWNETLQRSLSHYMQFDSVKTLLNEILKISILLQPPLYIGCSINLKDRITEHLEVKTGFAKRYLEGTGSMPISLRLVTLPIPFNSDQDLGENPELVKPLVDTIEDLFSRLYKPQWNLRYG